MSVGNETTGNDGFRSLEECARHPTEIEPEDIPEGLTSEERQDFLRAMRALGDIETKRQRSDLDTPTINPLTGKGRIGKFEVIRELGRSNSVVFLARDTECGRDVALKLPRLDSMLCPELKKRFIEEGRIATGLHHVGLVEVYEVEEWNGVCYIASAFAGEATLAMWLESRVEPVPPRTAAVVVAWLARAVDYLHDNRILHRDLKPSNVVLGPIGLGALPDRELAQVGIPRLTDFDLARMLDKPISSSQGGSITGGLVVGTAEYMAPEQAEGRPEALGRQTDVYGLGAILYEMLVGQPPIRGRNKFDTLRRVLSEQPAGLRRSRKDVPRDLEVICLKCLEKSTRHRYATAGHLADDLQRFLAGHRTLARRSPWWRRTIAWSKRRPGLAALATALLFVFLSLTLIWLGYQKHRDAEIIAHKQRVETAWAARHRGVDHCSRGEIGVGLLWLARGLVTAPPTEKELERLLRLDIGAWATQIPQITATLAHPARVWTLVFDPNTTKVATTSHDYAVRLWDATTGALLEPPMKHGAMVFALKFVAEGAMIETMCEDGIFRTWSTDTRQLISQRTAKTAKSTSPGRTIEIAWEFEVGHPPANQVADSGVVWKLLKSIEGNKMLTVDYGNNVRLWSTSPDVKYGYQLKHDGTVSDGDFSPDGRSVATTGTDRRIRFWDCASLVENDRPLELPAPARSVAFHPVGRLIAVGDNDNIVLWNLKTKNPAHVLPKQGPVHRLAFSRDGRRMASYRASTVRLWEIPSPPQGALRHPLLASGETAEQQGLRRMPFRGHSGIGAVLILPTHSKIAFSGVDNGIRLWSDDLQQEIRTLNGHENIVRSLALHPNKCVIASGSMDRTVRQWELETGHEVAPPMWHDHAVSCAVYSPDGSMIATGTLAEDYLQMWDGASAKIAEKYGPFDGIFDLAFSPNGEMIAGGCMKFAFCCDRRSGEITKLPHETTVHSIAFQPNGDEFVTGSGDGTLRWWDAKSLTCRTTVHGHVHRVEKIAFSNNGTMLATVGWDERLVFWDSGTRLSVGPAAMLSDGGQGVVFHSDGRRVGVGSKDGRLQWFPVPRPLLGHPKQISLWVQLITGMRFDAANSPSALVGGAWHHCQSELTSLGGPPTY